MEIKKFIKEQLENLAYKRGFVIDDIEIDFDEKLLISKLQKVEVYILTQEEIDEMSDDYPDYYADLKNGDIVYNDGEVAFKIDVVNIWIDEIKSNWKKGIMEVNDVGNYISYKYALHLSEGFLA